MTSKTWWLLPLVTVGLLSGCGKAKQPWEVVHPAKGVVHYKGEPLAGARITLIPQDGDVPETVRPSATSSEDGTFELGTYDKSDGAPAGNYKALVLHFPTVGPKENPSPGPNSLPKKYAKVETTDLTIELAEGVNDIPTLELR